MKLLYFIDKPEKVIQFFPDPVVPVGNDAFMGAENGVKAMAQDDFKAFDFLFQGFIRPEKPGSCGNEQITREQPLFIRFGQ